MNNEDYEIVSHQVLQDLKNEVELLSKQLAKPITSKDFLNKLDDVKRSIADLLGIIKKAAEKTEKETNTTEHTEMIQQMKRIEDQNEQIATALINIAEMIENWMKQQKTPPQQPTQKIMSPPNTLPNVSAPPFMPQNIPMPPPPKKRKGIFR